MRGIMANSTLALDRPIHLLDLLDQPFEAHAVEAELDAESASCTLRLEVTSAAWLRAWNDSLFQLGPEVIHGEPPEFDADQPVRLELEPTPLALRALLEQDEPDTALGAALLGEGAVSHILGRVAAWRARIAVQRAEPPPELADAVIEFGVSTVWGFTPEDGFDDATDDGGFALGGGEGGEGGEGEGLDILILVVEELLAFHELDWNTVEPGLYRIDLAVDSGVWTTLIHADSANEICAVTSIWPEQVAEASRADVALALAGRNYDLAVGSFELDPEDGEVRHRAGLDLGGAYPDPKVLEALILGSLQMVADSYDEIAELIG